MNTALAMANPIETLRKLKGRTWTELRARGEQALSAYTEQIGLSGKLPNDEEFYQLIDKSYFNGVTISKDALFSAFYENAAELYGLSPAEPRYRGPLSNGRGPTAPNSKASMSARRARKCASTSTRSGWTCWRATMWTGCTSTTSASRAPTSTTAAPRSSASVQRR